MQKFQSIESTLENTRAFHEKYQKQINLGNAAQNMGDFHLARLYYSFALELKDTDEIRALLFVIDQQEVATRLSLDSTSQAFNE